MRRFLLLLILLLLLCASAEAERVWHSGDVDLPFGGSARIEATVLDDGLLEVQIHRNSFDMLDGWNIYLNGSLAGSISLRSLWTEQTAHLECPADPLTSIVAVPVMFGYGEIADYAVFLSEGSDTRRWSCADVPCGSCSISASAELKDGTFRISLRQTVLDDSIVPESWALYLNDVFTSELSPGEFAPGVTLDGRYTAELTGITSLRSVIVVPVVGGQAYLRSAIRLEEIEEVPL